MTVIESNNHTSHPTEKSANALIAENEALKARIKQLEETEKVIAKGKREWELTFDSLSEIILITNLDGQILRCNRATTNKLNKSFPEIIEGIYSGLSPF